MRQDIPGNSIMGDAATADFGAVLAGTPVGARLVGDLQAFFGDSHSGVAQDLRSGPDNRFAATAAFEGALEMELRHEQG